MQINYNPDVLTCLANLSNDEVFTPPELANQVLDLLPKDIWEDKNTRFLDPVTKTGVFLREIAKRLMTGLEKEIPNEKERRNHIFNEQIYGIAITELTSLVSRRTLYCSRYANGEYSVCDSFSNNEGNIRFNKNGKHEWENGKCKYCGASKDLYNRDSSLETHAYELIHTDKPGEIFNMKFDVIIGNPPYQLNDGGAGASATPLYHKFVKQAKKLNPKYLTMIIPARWYTGGKGLDEFRKEMLKDTRIRVIHDFLNASECFPGVEIKGGVCYFLWDRDNKGNCKVITHENNKIISEMERPLLEKNSNVFIRYNEAVSILHKIQSKNEESFNKQISSRKPFAFPTNFTDFEEDYKDGYVKIYANQKQGYIPRNKIEKNQDWVDKWKLIVPKAIGIGNMKQDWIKTLIIGENTVCTETYLVIGPYNTKEEAECVYSYTQTKFYHFLVGLKKITQDTTQKVYEFVPNQNFNEQWNDKKLYKKYNLTKEEINYIETMVRTMDNGDDNE